MAVTQGHVQKTQTHYFVLHPYVFLVSGIKRGALYDLHRNRMLPLPESARYIVDMCEQHKPVQEVLQEVDDPDDREIASGYLTYLADNDFGDFRDNLNSYEKVHIDTGVFVRNGVHVLSVGIPLAPGPGDLSHAKWLELAARAHAAHVGQLSIFFLGEGLAPALELLRQIHDRFPSSKEVMLPPGEVSEETLTWMAGSNIRVLLPENAEANDRALPFYKAGLPLRVTACVPETEHDHGYHLMGEHLFAVSLSDYRHNTSWNANAFRLYVRPNGDVFPCHHEQYYLLGNLKLTPLDELVRGERVQNAWTMTRDRVARCGDCEFRYACPNTRVNRKDPEDYGSEPSNCGYDPATGVWQFHDVPLPYQMLKASRTGVAPESIEVVETRYFRIFAAKDYPHPEAYRDLPDRVVDEMVDQLGIEPPARRIDYFFYPPGQERRINKARHISFCGKMECYPEVNGPPRLVIHATFPCHTHEIIHALLYPVHAAGSFLVQEGVATMFHMAWGVEKDLCRSLASDEVEQGQADGAQYRMINAASKQELSREAVACDHYGLMMEPFRQHKDPHQVAAHVLKTRPEAGDMAELMRAGSKGSPRFVYQVAGSFFRYLLDRFGKEKFMDFYRSNQFRDDFQDIFGLSVEDGVAAWRYFLTETTAEETPPEAVPPQAEPPVISIAQNQESKEPVMSKPAETTVTPGPYSKADLKNLKPGAAPRGPVHQIRLSREDLAGGSRDEVIQRVLNDRAEQIKRKTDELRGDQPLSQEWIDKAAEALRREEQAGEPVVVKHETKAKQDKKTDKKEKNDKEETFGGFSGRVISRQKRSDGAMTVMLVQNDPREKRKGNGFQLIRRFMKNMDGFFKVWAAMVLVALVSAGLAVIYPWLFKDMVAQFTDKNYNGLAVGLAIYLGIQGLQIVFSELGSLFARSYALKANHRLIHSFFDRVQSLPMLTFMRFKNNGEIYRRVIDSVQLNVLVTTTLALAFVSVISYAVYTALIATIHLGIAVFLWALIPVYFAINYKLSKKSKEMEIDILESNSALTNHLMNGLNRIMTIKALGAKDRVLQDLTGYIGQNVDDSLEMVKYKTKAKLISRNLTLFARGAMIVTAAFMAMDGSLSFASAMVILALLPNVFGPLDGMVELMVQLGRTTAILERYFEVTDLEAETQRQKGNEKVELTGSCEVTLENLSFSYNEDKNVLHNLDLTLKAGERVALVGHSGAGKSTLAKLLLGFFQPGEGRIAINGKGLDHIDLEAYRKQLGVVLQDEFIFEGSVFDNVTFGLDRVCSKEEVEEALRNASIWDRIQEMDGGVDAVIRDDMLSGGEKQRVTLARAFLRDPGFLLLDEPTSALDNETEAAIQQAMERLLQNRTSVTIAHRLSTIMKADRILVMDDGRVVEEGTHEQLLAKQGHYARLYEGSIVS